MAESDVLAQFRESIELAYDRLGHQLGWRFLYTPASTLAPSTRLAFVALNPGDDKYHDPILSVEEGNAYRVERWWGARQQSGLQFQIRCLYQALAERDGGKTWDVLMDETLALNFCPFRSPSWDRLRRKKESIEFSQRMWARVLEIVEPSVIICLGVAPMRYLDRVLRLRRAHLKGQESHPIEWGRTDTSEGVTYKVGRYSTTHGEVTMLGLPHFSRYPIFGRPESRRATTEIVDVVSAALRS